MVVQRIDLEAADAWLIWDSSDIFDYCYGGTRLVDPASSDEEAQELGLRLALYESGPKNKIINDYLASATPLSTWPRGLSSSRVGPGRCIIRPKTKAFVWDEQNDSKTDLLSRLGIALNELNGRLKLTPDFGKFSSVADELYESTPHVLGVSGRNGGGGAKSAFTVTGFMQVIDSLEVLSDLNQHISVIGSAGSVGSQIVSKLRLREITVTNTSDLVSSPDVLGSSENYFLGTKGILAPSVLVGGGIIIVATWGGELAASNLSIIPPGSLLLPVHNLAFPPDALGKTLVDRLLANDITIVPSQLLTFGGAAGCRFEWFSRQEKTAVLNKPLVHDFVRSVAHATTEQLLKYWTKCTTTEKVESIITSNIS